jgi:phosphatidate cytidylyltransferase
MLRQRVLSSVVVLPVLILAIWFDGPWYVLVAAVVALLGIVEFYAMAGLARLQPVTLFGTLWTLFFIANACYAPSYGSETTQLLAALALVGSGVVVSLVCVLVQRRSGDRVLANWSWSLAGVLYMGLLLSYWVLMMDSYGREWVLIALLSTFAVDTSAYFVGRTWGKHRLAPSISPGKTWEGAVGGLVGSVAAAVLLSVFLDVGVAYWKVMLVGFAVGISAQLGDLTESKLKRSVGVKEAGNLIPGHGGILDRLDSVVFTGVVVYYCLEWLVG